jgi:hypothetical protein
MVTRFIALINLRRRGPPLQGICEVDVVYKRQMKYHKQLQMKNLGSSPCMALFICPNATKWHCNVIGLKHLQSKHAICVRLGKMDKQYLNIALFAMKH